MYTCPLRGDGVSSTALACKTHHLGLNANPLQQLLLAHMVRSRMYGSRCLLDEQELSSSSPPRFFSHSLHTHPATHLVFLLSR